MKFRLVNGSIHLTPVPDLDFNSNSNSTILKTEIARRLDVDESEFYLTQNGKLLSSCDKSSKDATIVVVPRVVGGKGGFGSMLRAIGAQIEKTTNRDACRDLSGRRLRDINEEQRLKRWYAKQKEREEEKAEARKKKLEKLKNITAGPPLPVIDDQQYNKQRAEMADSVYDAVDKGFESAIPEIVANSSSASATVTSTSTSDESSSDSSSEHKNSEPECSNSGTTGTNTKDKPSTETPSGSGTGKEVPAPKKKSAFKKTMLDEDLISCSSSSEDDEEIAPKKAKMAN